MSLTHLNEVYHVQMNHEYRNKIVNESWIIGEKKAGIMNLEGQMIPLPPPKHEHYIYKKKRKKKL